MLPIDYSIVTVSRELDKQGNFISQFVEKEYMKQNKAIQRALNMNGDGLFANANEKVNRFVEERLANLVTRYNEMALSDFESDADDEPKGEVYKKGKKKKKKKKKGGKKSGKKGGKKKKK